MRMFNNSYLNIFNITEEKNSKHIKTNQIKLCLLILFFFFWLNRKIFINKSFENNKVTAGY